MATTVRISTETHKLLQGLAALDGAPIGEWIARAAETQIAVLAKNGDLERMKVARAARLAEEDRLIEEAKVKGDATVGTGSSNTDTAPKRGRRGTAA